MSDTRSEHWPIEAPPSYTGYRSYSYLRHGADVKDVDFNPEIGRVDHLPLRLDPSQLTRLKRLFAEHTVISLHEHPLLHPADMREELSYIKAGRQWTGYAGLARSGLNVVFDNLLGGTGPLFSMAGWKYEEVVYDLGMRLADLAHQSYAVHAKTVADIRAAKAAQQLAMVFCVESATPIENELDRIDVLYGLGIRQMGIAYSESNLLGSGLTEPVDGGLTRFGHRAVERMNAVGMSIDISHSSDRTCLDAIAASSTPIFITHAGARAIWPIPRMKPDEVIIACAEAGGVIGISAAPHTTASVDHPTHTIESVMDHFRYCVDLVGIDHVTFGPDTVFGDHVGLHNLFSKALSNSAASGPEHELVPYVAGMENPGENFVNIVAWLIRHDYTDQEIAAVVGGNVLRVLNASWA